MMLKIEFFTLLRALVCQVEAQGDAQAHPCDAHPRHPCLKKPPELQPDTPNHLRHPLSKGERAKDSSKAAVILCL